MQGLATGVHQVLSPARVVSISYDMFLGGSETDQCYSKGATDFT